MKRLLNPVFSVIHIFCNTDAFARFAGINYLEPDSSVAPLDTSLNLATTTT
jgi:hypothetical protein